MRPAILFLVALACACAAPQKGTVLNPAYGPGTDYPCDYQAAEGYRVHGHSCGQHMCCDDGMDCGGPVGGCPPGECCPAPMTPGFSKQKPAAHQRPEA